MIIVHDIIFLFFFFAFLNFFSYTRAPRAHVLGKYENVVFTLKTYSKCLTSKLHRRNLKKQRYQSFWIVFEGTSGSTVKSLLFENLGFRKAFRSHENAKPASWFEERFRKPPFS